CAVGSSAGSASEPASSASAVDRAAASSAFADASCCFACSTLDCALSTEFVSLQAVTAIATTASRISNACAEYFLFIIISPYADTVSVSAYCHPTKHSMNPVTEFTAGLPYLLRGFNLIREPYLRRYVVIPLLINVVLIIALLGLFGWQLDNWLDAWLAGLPGWLAWLETLLWWLGLITASLLFCYFFTFLASLVAGPFNGILSSRVEQLLTGNQPDSVMTLIGEMADGVTGTLRMLWYSLSRAAV